MKQLVLRNKTQEWVLRSIGVLFLFASVVHAVSTDWETFLDFLIPVLYCITGIGYITNYFGTLINRLSIHDGLLVIRWHSKFSREKILHDNISQIIGDDNFIRIILKSGKPILLTITMLEPWEVRLVYKFLIEAKDK